MGLLGIAWNVGFGLGPWLGGKIGTHGATVRSGPPWDSWASCSGAYLLLGRSASGRFNPSRSEPVQEVLHSG